MAIIRENMRRRDRSLPKEEMRKRNEEKLEVLRFSCARASVFRRLYIVEVTEK